MGDGDTDERAVEASARVGFAARGVLYLIVGLLVAQVALGDAGEDASQQGAMNAVSQQPFGTFLLAALALGLAGYALFRAVQAMQGKGAGSVLDRRVVPAARATVNAGLCALALQQLFGGGGEGSESGATATVLGWPGGQWLVGTVGAVVFGVGVRQLLDAWRGDVNELAEPHDLPAGSRRIVRTVGRLGHAGRGVAFLAVGGFLVRAAITHDPDEGVGLDAALGELAGAPFGTALLLGIALCLALFGVHCAVEAFYGDTSVGS